MKTAVIYARYSSDKQNEQSIEGQVHVCTQFAQQNDILILDTYVDRAMTGKNDNRAAFQKMLKDSDKKAWDYVLVYKLDRFSRNKYETAIHKKRLRDNGIRLKSATENIPDTPEGIILESMLEGMAEYYSAELSQKIRRGNNESREKGQWTGGKILYGYICKNKKIYIDEDQAKVVRYIFEQFANDVYVKDIAQELIQQGILHKGKPFPVSTLYKMLRNEKYIGQCLVNNTVYTNIYPPILSNELYETVKNKLAANHYGKHVADVVYLLKGKIICGYCGKSMVSETGTEINGTIKRYYKCLSRKRNRSCNKTVVRKDLLENLVVETTIKILNNKDLIKQLAMKILEAHKNRIRDTTAINLLESELLDVNTSIKNLIVAIEKGILSDSTKQRLDELEMSKQELESKISIAKAKEKYEITEDEITDYILTAVRKKPKQMIDALIDKIVLYDDKIEIYYKYTEKFDSDDNDSRRNFLFYKDNYECTLSSRKYDSSKQQKFNDISFKLNIELYL